VPTPSAPSGVASTDGDYAASAWVGIDGNTYSTAILQTGLDFAVSTSGAVSYDARYEWYPDYAMDLISQSLLAMSVSTQTSHCLSPS
jgi:hypothetical protein